MSQLIKSFFNYFERKAIEKNHWLMIPGSEWECFYIDIQTYKGKEIVLEDGTSLIQGDVIAEMHVNNKKMIDVKEFRMIFRILNSELSNLAKATIEHKGFNKIKAFYGRTVLYPIMTKYAFEVREIQGAGLKLFLRIWDNLIKKVFSSSKKGRFKLREPKEIWISSEKLVDKMKIRRG